jgi:hypothetical protein
MTPESEPAERCAICGREISDGRRSCRFYPAGRPVAFCRPECAEIYLTGARNAKDGPAEGVMEGPVQERAWQNFGYEPSARDEVWGQEMRSGC